MTPINFVDSRWPRQQRPILEAPPAPARLQQEATSVAELRQLIADIRVQIESLRSQSGPPGDKGPTGDKGVIGDKGPIGDQAKIDYDAIAAAVVVRIEPIMDAKIQQAVENFRATMPPIRVQAYSSDGKLIDEEVYPIGTPIKLRHGVRIQQ